MEEACTFYENLISEERLAKSTSVIAKTGVEPKWEDKYPLISAIKGPKITNLAKTLGVSQSHVYKRLCFLYLHETIQTMLDNELYLQ